MKGKILSGLVVVQKMQNFILDIVKAADSLGCIQPFVSVSVMKKSNSYFLFIVLYCIVLWWRRMAKNLQRNYSFFPSFIFLFDSIAAIDACLTLLEALLFGMAFYFIYRTKESEKQGHSALASDRQDGKAGSEPCRPKLHSAVSQQKQRHNSVVVGGGGVGVQSETSSLHILDPRLLSYQSLTNIQHADESDSQT